MLKFEKKRKDWIIQGAYPIYGPNVPDDVYFVSCEYNSVGKKVDIDKIINESWVIPDENGNLYKILNQKIL